LRPHDDADPPIPQLGPNHDPYHFLYHLAAGFGWYDWIQPYCLHAQMGFG